MPESSQTNPDMNRRQFLGDSAMNAAGVATAGLVGITASSAQASNSPSERISVGVIGVRNRGLKLAEKFASRTDVDVRMICDVDESKMVHARTVLNEQRNPMNMATDYRQVIDDQNIDAVVIATPDHWHAQMAGEAFLAGKDVYLECPVTHLPNEGRDLLVLANNSKQVIQAGMQQRSGEHFLSAIQTIRDGGIGDVKIAKAWVSHVRKPIGVKRATSSPSGVDYQAWLGAAKPRAFQPNRFHFNWRWFWDYGSGELGVWGVHLLDVACWGMNVNTPKRVTASGGRFHFSDDQETPDTLNVNFDFGDCAIQWEHRQWTPHGNENRTAAVAFYGTNGTLVIDRGGWKVYDRKESLTAPASDLLEPHIANFVNCIRTREQPAANLQDAVLASNLCHWANESYRSGGPITPV